MEGKAAKAQEAFEKEEKHRKELEVSLAKANQEKADLMSRLTGETNVVADLHDKQNKLMAQKSDLESQLTVSRQIEKASVHPVRVINRGVTNDCTDMDAEHPRCNMLSYNTLDCNATKVSNIFPLYDAILGLNFGHEPQRVSQETVDDFVESNQPLRFSEIIEEGENERVKSGRSETRGLERGLFLGA